MLTFKDFIIEKNQYPSQDADVFQIKINKKDLKFALDKFGRITLMTHKGRLVKDIFGVLPDYFKKTEGFNWNRQSKLFLCRGRCNTYLDKDMMDDMKIKGLYYE